MMNSIGILKRYRINVTANSVHLRNELNAYRWKVKNGITVNEPVDFMNHAIDALRYVALNLLNNVRKGKYSIMV
jgi:phage terminase large subunit